MFFIKVIFFLFNILFPLEVFSQNIHIEPFAGGQILGTSSFTANGANYSSKVTDITGGLRLALSEGSLSFGAEGYFGKEKSIRYELEETLHKYNIGVFLSFINNNLVYRFTYYLSSNKLIKVDGNVGLGDIDDQMKGSGAGFGIGYKIWSFLQFNYDFRYIVYHEVDGLELPTNTYSAVKDIEFSFGLSFPLSALTQN